MDETGEFKYRVRNALGWAAGTRLVAQVINWGLTLATVRFLHPEEYGLMSMTMAFTGFILAFSYAGFADAIVQNRETNERELRSIFALILLVNFACIIAVCILAYPASIFFEEPRLVPLIQASSLLFIVNAFQIIPRAMLDKRLNMKTVSQAELLSKVIGGVLVLILAAAGAGAWSLVIGLLFTAFFRTIVFNFVSPFLLLPRFSFGISRMARAGWLRTGETVLWSLCANADIFIVGKILGPDVLGVYSVARDLAAMPVEKLSQVIKPVAFPAFVQVQHDLAMALGYLRKSMRLLAFVTFPVLFGLSAVAPWVVTIVFGEKWSGAATPVAILAIAMAWHAIGLLLAPFLISIGHFTASFKITVIASVLFPVALLIGSHWGLLGVCIAWLVGNPLYLFLLLRRIVLITDVPKMMLIKPLLSPLAGSLIMYVVVRTIAVNLPSGGHELNSLIFLSIVGAAIYLVYSLVFLRQIFGEFFNLVRR